MATPVNAAGKFVPADGGNGGRGGDVAIQASAAVKSLTNVRRVQRGAAGGAGANQRQRGADGADLTLHVPCGTVVYRSTDLAGRFARDAGRPRPIVVYLMAAPGVCRQRGCSQPQAATAAAATHMAGSARSQ